MKIGDTAKKMSYLAAGAGVVLFAFTGLLPGSLIGGAIGLDIVACFSGFPVSSDLLPRLIVGLSMILGVLVSALIYIVSSASAGFLVGRIVDALKTRKPLEAHITNDQ